MNSSLGKVLIAAPVHQVLVDGLKNLGYQCITEEQITQTSASGHIAGCVGVITSTRLQLDSTLLDAAPLLQWIGRMGSGMEVIDLEHAAKRGIVCFSSPEGNCNAVGEHAVGMLLALIRHISWSQSELIDGVWRRDENRGIELEGKTVGIIGFGHTGAAFARKLAGFDVRLLAYDKYHPGGIPPHITNCNGLNEIFAEADIVSFHVPLLPETVSYFDAEFISKMAKPFILVNTSRGQVVNTMALDLGISSGKVMGACLDVFEQEPVTKADSALRTVIERLVRLPNIIVTPHIAGYTFEALYKMSQTLLDKITLFNLQQEK
jgi:D-3-phosphoglycerate dehydrogenase